MAEAVAALPGKRRTVVGTFETWGRILVVPYLVVFVLLDGAWLTPPLAAGVLPGVMRSVLLEDPAWAAREARLTVDDLMRAQQVVVCNALRGAMRAALRRESLAG